MIIGVDQLVAFMKANIEIVSNQLIDIGGA